MEKLKLSEIYNLFGYESNSSVCLDSVSTDSRKIVAGSLFVPIRGEKFDGHDFIPKAFNSGALAALCNKDYDSNDPRLIKVDDTLRAYHKIASWYRDKFSIPVVAVTGSNGKTGTKDMLYSVLSSKYRTLKTEANHNNEIGVPETIMKLSRSTEALVIEMGMRGKGQIKELRDMVKPTVALITMIGESHFELLGSFKAIAEAKAEIADGFSEKEILILNADDKWSTHIASITQGTKKYFGTSASADLKIVYANPLGFKGFDVEFEWQSEKIKGKLGFAGLHNVHNAAAALLAGIMCGVEPAAGFKALSHTEMTSKRMEILESCDGMIIINDCYNASPSSVAAALETLSGYAEKYRTIAVLGDMKELGEVTLSSHEQIGKIVAGSGTDIFVAVGENAAVAAKSAQLYGMPQENIFIFQTAEDGAEQIEQMLRKDDVILIKGSRAMALEKITDYIADRHPLKEE